MKIGQILLLGILLPSLSQAGTIRCQEFDPDDFDGTGEKSKIEIQVNAKGEAESLVWERFATEETPAAKWAFTKDKLRHRTEKNKVDFVDEETKEPVYWGGIEDVETFEATSKNGRQLKLVINDHRYSGTPGSSLYFGPQKTRSDFNVSCEGAVKFPQKAASEE